MEKLEEQEETLRFQHYFHSACSSTPNITAIVCLLLCFSVSKLNYTKEVVTFETRTVIWPKEAQGGCQVLQKAKNEALITSPCWATCLQYNIRRYGVVFCNAQLCPLRHVQNSTV